MKDFPSTDEQAENRLIDVPDDTEQERNLSLAIYRYFRSEGFTVKEAWGHTLVAMMEIVGMADGGPDEGLVEVEKN